ncbi:MAG TPA: hypothetical protein VHF22_11005 [Planctomycetota bacterium]|nr:hypothetical protein [Planctomycetota bacterium]
MAHDPEELDEQESRCLVQLLDAHLWRLRFQPVQGKAVGADERRPDAGVLRPNLVERAVGDGHQGHLTEADVAPPPEVAERAVELADARLGRMLYQARKPSIDAVFVVGSHREFNAVLWREDARRGNDFTGENFALRKRA